MRKITIERAKSAAGCLMKLKIYMVDAGAEEIRINQLPCRKIGEIKNGEQKEFSVDENEHGFFVIADQISKDYCNDFVRVPAGENDVFLRGQNQFNPLTGNAFRFDGVPDCSALQNRRISSKKGIMIFSLLLVVCFAVGGLIRAALISEQTNQPKDFSREGMQITLTNAFSEIEVEGYTVCYGSKETAVFTLKEKFSQAEGLESITLEQYGALVLANNQYAASASLQKSGGLTCFEYQHENAGDGKTYHYLTFLYRASDAFWQIQFAASEDDYRKYQSRFYDWAGTVRFSDPV